MEQLHQDGVPVSSKTEGRFDEIVQGVLKKNLDPILELGGKIDTLMCESWAGFSEKELLDYRLAIAEQCTEVFSIPYQPRDAESMRLYLKDFDGIMERCVKTMIPHLESMQKNPNIPQPVQENVQDMLGQLVGLPFRNTEAHRYDPRGTPGIRCGG